MGTSPSIGFDPASGIVDVRGAWTCKENFSEIGVGNMILAIRFHQGVSWFPKTARRRW